MFAITQAQRIRRDAERARRTYISSVRQLHTEIFNLSPQDVAKHDTAWLEWLKVPPRVWVTEGFNRDSPEVALIALLSDLSVDEAFRARALAGFFAPEAHWIPFGWSVKAVLGQERYRYYAYTPHVVVDLYDYGSFDGELDIDRILACASPSLRLLTFVGKIIPLSLAAARNVPQTPRNWGAEYWFRFGNFHDIILLVLAQLSEDDSLAEELFNNYNLDGTDQLKLLMGAPISLKWKALADEKVRALIQESGDCIAHKRSDAEKEYRECANWFVDWDPKELPYSISLFRSQVDFLLGRGQIVLGHGVYGSDRIYVSVHTVIALLEGDLELCHRFCRHLVLKTSFITKGIINVGAAERIMHLFGHTDTELQEKLSPVMEVITRRREDFARNEGTREEDRVTMLAQVLAHTK